MTSQRQKLTDEQHIMALVPRGHLLDVVPNKLEARPVARSTKLPPFAAVSKSAATWSYIFIAIRLAVLGTTVARWRRCSDTLRWLRLALPFAERWSGRHSLQRCIASWWSLHFRALVARSAVIARARRGLHTWARICHSLHRQNMALAASAEVLHMAHVRHTKCRALGHWHGAMLTAQQLGAWRIFRRARAIAAAFRALIMAAERADRQDALDRTTWRRYRRAACARHFAMWVKGACDLASDGARVSAAAAALQPVRLAVGLSDWRRAHAEATTLGRCARRLAHVLCLSRCSLAMSAWGACLARRHADRRAHVRADARRLSSAWFRFRDGVLAIGLARAVDACLRSADCMHAMRLGLRKWFRAARGAVLWQLAVRRRTRGHALREHVRRWRDWQLSRLQLLETWRAVQVRAVLICALRRWSEHTRLAIQQCTRRGAEGMRSLLWL